MRTKFYELRASIFRLRVFRIAPREWGAKVFYGGHWCRVRHAAGGLFKAATKKACIAHIRYAYEGKYPREEGKL